jgi:excisionase family DNA binding protein
MSQITEILERIEKIMTDHHRENKEILTVNEAAEFLNLETSYLYQLTSKRLIPFYRPGRKLYFKKSDLVDWISKHRQATVTEVINKSY